MHACMQHAQVLPSLTVQCMRAAVNCCGAVAQVSFEIADITSCDLADESYDVVYSRDTILHIHDKPALFKRSALHTPSMARGLLAAGC